VIRVTGGQASLPPQPNVLVWRGDDRLSSSSPPGKRRSTLCGYLAGCLVLRFQRSNGQIPGYQARTSPPPRQRIAYPVQALGGSGKAFGCFLSSQGGVILAQKLPAKVVLRPAWDGPRWHLG
jgi:hypothetical protein